MLIIQNQLLTREIRCILLNEFCCFALYAVFFRFFCRVSVCSTCFSSFLSCFTVEISVAGNLFSNYKQLAGLQGSASHDAVAICLFSFSPWAHCLTVFCHLSPFLCGLSQYEKNSLLNWEMLNIFEAVFAFFSVGAVTNECLVCGAIRGDIQHKGESVGDE